MDEVLRKLHARAQKKAKGARRLPAVIRRALETYAENFWQQSNGINQTRIDAAKTAWNKAEYALCEWLDKQAT